MSERPLSAGVAALLLGLLLWGCDIGSSGRGSYAGSVELEEGAPGSALLLVTGEGLIRVEGTGGTMGWSGTPSGDPGEMRVLLVDPDPSGAMTFRLFVEDVSAPTALFSVLQLADRQNERFETEDIQIRLRR